MKQRLLVMNGQRLVQTEHGGQWQTEKVEKAGAVKPGIYDIHRAAAADKNKQYDGAIIYVDKSSVFQQIGKSLIKHDRGDFDKVPEIGANSNVKYDDGKALVSPSSVKLGRRIS
jgi:hypothetical protein